MTFNRLLFVMASVAVTVILCTVTTVFSTAPHSLVIHENFWENPEFFASLSDYLTGVPTPTQIPTKSKPEIKVSGVQQSTTSSPYLTYHYKNAGLTSVPQTQVVRNEIYSRTLQHPVSSTLSQIKPSFVNPQLFIRQSSSLRSHPNSLISSAPSKTRRRPPLLKHKNKRKRLRSTIATTTTSTTTTVKPINGTFVQSNSTTVKPTTTSTTKTSNVPEYDYTYDDDDYYSEEQIVPTPIKTYNSPARSIVQHQQQQQIRHPSSASSYSTRIIPLQQKQNIVLRPQPFSPNSDLIPAQEVYQSSDSFGVPSEQFGVRIPAPAYYRNTRVIGNYQHAPQQQQQIQLNPNILIAVPNSQQQQERSRGEQLAQASNLFPIGNQDENGVKQESPSIVGKISDMLETGRRILYFPKGVVDVLDHAYVMADPYVSVVMSTLADSILGSTKGMAVPPPNNKNVNINKPHTLLIANPVKNQNPPKKS